MIRTGRLSRRVCRFSAALITFTTLFPLARAEPSSPDVSPAPQTTQIKSLRQEGKTCYRKRDYNCALERFEKAFALSPSPTMLFNVASAQDKLGIYPLAAQNYRRYLQQAGVQASPQGLLHIQRRLEQLLPRVARLQLTLQPPETAGTLPHPDATGTLPHPNATGTLQPPNATGTLQHPDMQVTLNDNPVDLTWMRVQGQTYEIVVSPGVHRLQVSAAGHEPHRETLTLTAGEQASRTIQLKAAMTTGHGTLHLTSIPSGARIWIDGKAITQLTPTQIPQLTVGTHQVKVAAATLAYEGQVTIVAGTTTSLQAELLPQATSSSLLTSNAQLGNEPRPAPHKKDTPILPHLNSAFPLEAGELGRWVAFHLDLTSARDIILYSLGVETRYTFFDRFEAGFHLPVLIQRVASAGDTYAGKAYFGDLRIKLKTRLMGGRQRHFVLSIYMHGDLPTNGMDLEDRAYTLQRLGLATTLWVKGFTLGGDIGLHLGIGPGSDWVIPLANAYLGKELGYGFGLQLAAQFAQSVKPMLDEPSLALTPTVTFTPLPTVQVGASLQLALTDVGRHTYNYWAQALFIMDLRYHY